MADRQQAEGRRKTALVTGASAGIGRELAREFARNGFDLVLAARRRERLTALAAELRDRYGSTSRVEEIDLSDPSAPQALWERLEDAGIRVDALVNNAGYMTPGHFDAAPWEEHERFIEVMVSAPTALCHLFAPGMAARGYGRILNVASIAALVPASGGGALYAASKAFMIKMTESLSDEYMDRNVHVVALCPGFTRTEFQEVAGRQALTGKTPAFLWMEANAVARDGFRAVMEKTPVVIPGALNRMIALFFRLMPTGLMRRVMLRVRRGGERQIMRDND